MNKGGDSEPEKEKEKNNKKNKIWWNDNEIIMKMKIIIKKKWEKN